MISAFITGTVVKYWEIIANNLASHGWSWGLGTVTAVDGSTLFVADAHLGDGKRFIVRADDKLDAFLVLESVIREAEIRRVLN